MTVSPQRRPGATSPSSSSISNASAPPSAAHESSSGSGISGQIQHIAGMQESGIIISINNDPDAPINTIADYVINGSIEEVVPKMIKYYKQNSK